MKKGIGYVRFLTTFVTPLLTIFWKVYLRLLCPSAVERDRVIKDGKYTVLALCGWMCLSDWEILWQNSESKQVIEWELCKQLLLIFHIPLMSFNFFNVDITEGVIRFVAFRIHSRSTIRNYNLYKNSFLKKLRIFKIYEIVIVARIVRNRRIYETLNEMFLLFTLPTKWDMVPANNFYGLI